MAEYLASIFGTEKDKVNCSFYFKIGACRHGDQCARLHNVPTFSQTMLLAHLYDNKQFDPVNPERWTGPGTVTDNLQEQQRFDDFFEEIFFELEEKYGEIEEMNVVDNIGEHMIGNVYIKFKREEDAEKAVKGCNERWFSGRPIYAELSPVSDFREACCRQFETGECIKGGFCNFMHLKTISRGLERKLFHGRVRKPRRSRSRSRSRERGGRGGGGGGGGSGASRRDSDDRYGGGRNGDRRGGRY